MPRPSDAALWELVKKLANPKLDQHTRHQLELIGQQFLRDPSVATKLLFALLDLPDQTRQHVINQAWLNVHWEDSDVRGTLTVIWNMCNRRPEPIIDFLRVCWHHNDTFHWHYFLSDDMLDCPDTACELYRRFDIEGPTRLVIDNMKFFAEFLQLLIFLLLFLLVRGGRGRGFTG